MVTVCYEDGAYRVGGLPDNQTLAFDTLADVNDAARAMLNAADTCYYSRSEANRLENQFYWGGMRLNF